MNAFVWNLLLALLWAVAAGDFTLSNLLLGFVLGFFVLYFTRASLGWGNYGGKAIGLVRLILLFIWELFWASLRVAYDILTPTHHMRPAIIAVPLDIQSDEEITLLANLITLTPGTLSLDVSADRRVLYVHAMYIDEDGLDQARRNIKDGFERPIKELFR